MPERLLIGPGSPPSLDPVYPELSPPLEPCRFSGHGGMVQERVTAQGWLGSTDARRATPPDPRPPRWGRAGCCQLDPSHPTLVTCAVGREGRHAPRPNDVGGQPRFPGAREWVAHSASVNLRLGHRAPGRGGRRASIPLHALTTLLSALGAFCLWEFRVFSTNLNILRSICSGHGDPARRAAATAAPRRFTEVVPTPHAYSGQWPVKPIVPPSAAPSRPVNLGLGDLVLIVTCLYTAVW
jgi:hypothetical protein